LTGVVIELSAEMATRLSTALVDGCPVIAASVDADGQPKLAFYGSTHVHDADHLALWARNPESGLFDRIAANPRMSFLYRHPTDRIRWVFEGRAAVVTDEAVAGAVYDAIPAFEQSVDPDRKGRAIIIEVDRVTGRDLSMER
jgi:hypothetical protein